MLWKCCWVWAKTRIPTRRMQHCVSKIERLFNRCGHRRRMQIEIQSRSMQIKQHVSASWTISLIQPTWMHGVSWRLMKTNSSFWHRENLCGFSWSDISISRSKNCLAKAAMNYKQRADKKRTCCYSQLFCQAVATIPPVMTGDEIADASQKGRGNGESATGVDQSINQSEED